MANYTCEWKSAVITLAPATIDTVTITGDAVDLEVYNRGSSRLSFRYGSNGVAPNSQASLAADPVADAAENDHLEPGEALVFTSAYKPDVLKLISTAGTVYTVRGIPK